jgi:hypothetical protein
MGVDSLWSQTRLYNKSYLINFRRWNYNFTFYYYYRICNLSALLLNATPLVRRFFAKMSKKRQRCAVVNIGGDSRNFANLQIVNETANAMLQQCWLSWF